MPPPSIKNCGRCGRNCSTTTGGTCCFDSKIGRMDCTPDKGDHCCPGGGFCPKILVADVKVGLLDLGFVFATRTMQFLYCLGHLRALLAAPVNRNAHPEAQHVIVPKLLCRVLPHVLHVEIGVEVFLGQLQLQTLVLHHLLLSSNLGVLVASGG